MSNIDHSVERDAPAHHAHSPQPDRLSSILELPTHMAVDKANEQALQKALETRSDAIGLEMAARAQLEALRTSLEHLTGPDLAGARVLAQSLERAQAHSLREFESNLKLRSLELRLAMEQGSHRQPGAVLMHEGTKQVSEAVLANSRAEVSRVNLAMREAVAAWSAFPHGATFSSTHSNFSVDTSGRATLYARPGEAGSIDARLPDGAAVHVELTTTKHGDIMWNWQQNGELRPDASHPPEGAHTPHFHLNLETTAGRIETRAGNAADKSSRDMGIQAGASAQAKVAEVELAGGARLAEERVHETRAAETVNRESGSSKVALSLDVRFTEAPAARIEILNERHRR